MSLKIKIQLRWIKVRAWLGLVTVFIVYLLTQPFVEIWNFVKLLLQKGAKLNHPRAWMPIFFIFTILCYLAKSRYLTNVFGILLFITIIKWEWDKKDFVHIHRERMFRKLMFRRRKDEAQQAQPTTRKEVEIKEQTIGGEKNENTPGN